MTVEEKRLLAIGRAVDRVRKELPQEFDLHIELAAGEGNVALHSPNEGGSGLRNWEGDTLAAQIHIALSYAVSMARFTSTPIVPKAENPSALQRQVADYIRNAVNFPIAFLTSGAEWKDRDPLDVMFYWEEPGFGEIARFNLRDELVEMFADDPTLREDRLAKTLKALRDLADQLEALPKPAA